MTESGVIGLVSAGKRLRWRATAALPGMIRIFALIGAALFALAAADPSYAARRAFIVGVSDYKKERGLAPLNAPANDADELAKMLSSRGLDFQVETLRNDDVKDKAAFDSRLQAFVATLAPDDEVLFFFSGHGLYLAGQESNYYLLPDAKSQAIHLKDLGAAARSLDTEEKRKQSYQDWIAQVAVSEKAVEQAITGKTVKVLVIVADACRSLLSGGKGASIDDVMGVYLPKESARGVFRLYSASKGQVSFDAPERLNSQTGRTSTSTSGDPNSKKSDTKRLNSLFTQVLLRFLPEPGLDIAVLAAKVRVEVREQARRLNLGADQIPDFTDDQGATEYFLFRGDKSEMIAARCKTADTELAQLRYGVALGSIGRDSLEQKRYELAPCGKADEIAALLRFEGQGAGALSDSQLQAAIPDSDDPLQRCDLRGSSPLDPNRPQGVSGVEIQKLALSAISGEIDKAKAADSINSVIKACEAAVKQRDRVARYRYNLGRAHYAAALIAAPLDKEYSLQKASQLYQQAVDLGYAAAYNDLALMHQNGEYYNEKGERQAANRKKAKELLERGANLGHVVAHYNLGMAYKNGELRVEDEQQAFSDYHLVLAFQHLSKAAEGGFVPAVIETALALDQGRGIEVNQGRAIELLELAASRGSWEAMYCIGEIYQRDQRKFDRAIVWHARAAESGDSRSQEELAGMLQRGDGLPAPQPEAAGRYWRLAADAGRLTAQMQLAVLLRDGKVPFRPKMDGPPDGGGEEIRNLFAQALARGNPWAGLWLAQLYRTGYPKDNPSKAIQLDPKRAVELYYQTMNTVRSAPADSDYANPQVEALAAFDLMDMYNKGEAKGKDGASLITLDQSDQLKADYGDASSLYWVPTTALGPINCAAQSQYRVMVWDWSRDVSPTEHQFDWFERRYHCKEVARPSDTSKKTKTVELGVTKKTRENFTRLFKDWKKDKDKKLTYADRIAQYIAKNTR